MNFHTRHEYIKTIGQRISRGGWERLNRAYEVHNAGKIKVVGYDESGKAQLGPATTNVLMRETTKCNRKVSMSNRFKANGTRCRYLGEPMGHTR